MHFEIRSTGRHLWTWVLLDETRMPVLESDRTFASQMQASAAALAFVRLVSRAGRSLTAGPTGGLI
ncbi:hypothetical protein MKK75_29710 [Methylobacterium sp. J-030]|uniref:hypothetical protein n=1 Tax=Methylobacterium sp. J-030 TaxID=2836627 RepID=UPI001FB9194E|nr:hypothetical protein [Methylobacterium sp. J-030]MCJ2072921.1 hypothetical protein [Methylobacterium sp. J-030]